MVRAELKIFNIIRGQPHQTGWQRIIRWLGRKSDWLSLCFCVYGKIFILKINIRICRSIGTLFWLVLWNAGVCCQFSCLGGMLLFYWWTNRWTHFSFVINLSIFWFYIGVSLSPSSLWSAFFSSPSHVYY